MRYSSVTGAAVAVFALGSVFAQQCYHPDGSRITDPAYQACNQVQGAISQCCGTNHTGGKVAPDRCLPNGLCQNTGDLVYWRNGCTDQTFGSRFCLNICLDSDLGGDSQDNAPIKSCPDNTWCCSGKTPRGSDCCSNSTRRFSLPATIGILTTTSSTVSSTSSATSTSTSTTSSSTSPSSNITAPPNNNPGWSPSTTIGLGVGIPVGVVALAIVVGVFLYLRRRDRKRFEALSQNENGPHINGVPYSHGDVVEAHAVKYDGTYEMDSHRPPAEMEGYGRQAAKPRYELYS